MADLIRFNPTIQNQQEDHSLWLAERTLSVGANVDGFIFVTRDALPSPTMQALKTDFTGASGSNQFLRFLNGVLSVLAIPTQALSLRYNGCWFNVDQGTILGIARNVSGVGNILIPFNTHNMGRQFQRSQPPFGSGTTNTPWRPSIVN